MGGIVTSNRLIRIKILGDFEVLRPNGTHVQPHEWRTGKTMDLLRLLALDNGHPVRQTLLMERLWPDVSADKARGSLRTAASRIRRAIGQNCIIRQPGSLLLSDAWVDVVAYRAEARRAHAAALTADHVQTLDLTRAAESVYGGDFHAYDDESAWVRIERDALARLRHATLCEAAEAALKLGLHRDALDHGSAAVRIDPTSDLAHRTLMRAYAEVGEVGTALRVFESYRTHLAEELGADPSRQTRDLHLRLLRGSDA